MEFARRVEWDYNFQLITACYDILSLQNIILIYMASTVFAYPIYSPILRKNISLFFLTLEHFFYII
jgi:hypothetical protein